jgi:galactokinase
MNHRSMVETSGQLFSSWFGTPPEFIARAPGRVNLIGEHTDYNGGYVLPIAIRESIYVAARLLEAKPAVITIRAADLDETGSLDGEGNLRSDTGAWISYPRGVVRLLAQQGAEIPSVEALVTGDLPVGTGVSSSAALTVAFLNLFLSLARQSLPDLEIARLAQKVENDFAGVQCGIMDPLASQAGRRDHALFIDCARLATSYIPVDLPDQTLILFNTGVRRKLAESAYNRIRSECETAARLLGVDYLSMASRQHLEQRRDQLGESLYQRALHVIDENRRVLDATSALAASDPRGFGRLLTESHRSLRDLYRVSCPELDLMVDLAARLPGWYGGRMVGAGFGGCTIHLVDKDKAGGFVKAMSESYEAATGIRPESFEVSPSEGASCLRLGS